MLPRRRIHTRVTTLFDYTRFVAVPHILSHDSPSSQSTTAQCLSARPIASDWRPAVRSECFLSMAAHQLTRHGPQGPQRDRRRRVCWAFSHMSAGVLTAGSAAAMCAARTLEHRVYRSPRPLRQLRLLRSPTLPLRADVRQVGTVKAAGPTGHALACDAADSQVDFKRALKGWPVY